MQTKFGVATIQNPAGNTGYIRIHTSFKMHNNLIVRRFLSLYLESWATPGNSASYL
jgi:hypothetical protein